MISIVARLVLQILKNGVKLFLAILGARRKHTLSLDS